VFDAAGRSQRSLGQELRLLLSNREKPAGSQMRHAA